jgi:hypothetical protein
VQIAASGPASTVMSRWPAHGLKPHLVRSAKVSRDPKFAEKLEDIVRLYMPSPRCLPRSMSAMGSLSSSSSRDTHIEWLKFLKKIDRAPQRQVPKGAKQYTCDAPWRPLLPDLVTDNGTSAWLWKPVE